MKTNSTALLTIFVAALFNNLAADEIVPSIESNGDWTKVQFMTADQIKIDYVWMPDGSVIVSIFHIFDRKTEKPVTFSDQLDVDGLKIEDLSNPPMQIGYRDGNLEFSQSICRVIPLDLESEIVYLPKHVFSHTPEYWPFVLPYPLQLPKKKTSLPEEQFLKSAAKADVLKRSANYDEAELTYRSLLSKDLAPTHRAMALLDLGITLIFKKEYELAAEELLKVLDIKETDKSTINFLESHRDQATRFLAHCYAAEGNFPEALEYAHSARSNYLRLMASEQDGESTPESFDAWVGALREIADSAQAKANKAAGS